MLVLTTINLPIKKWAEAKLGDKLAFISMFAPWGKENDPIPYFNETYFHWLLRKDNNG